MNNPRDDTKNETGESVERMLQDVSRYYSEKLREHGLSHKGVDWPSQESQELRFEQLMKACDTLVPFSINDYGCGYGALLAYLLDKGCDVQYCGYDISPAMISSAQACFQESQRCSFFLDEADLPRADYTVASGVFNVKLDAHPQEWQSHVVSVLHTMDRLSSGGFSFNILTSYSDKELMQSYLYYADPRFYFDYCKRRFSKNVALLHDYGLYEFTILVRKASGGAGAESAIG